MQAGPDMEWSKTVGDGGSALWVEKVLPGVLACVLWGCASSVIILLNKYLISRTGFDAPMVLCSLGMLFSR